MSDLLNAIINPIPGANPYGGNINYDLDFDCVKGEMGKMGGADYDKVLAAARRIISEKSKDIRVLAFISFIYLRNEQWEELADTFEGLAKLCATDLEKLFPERENAKIMAFKWLAEGRYNALLDEKKPAAENYSQLLRLQTAVAELQKILDLKFGAASPFPTGLLKAAANWESVCKPKPVAPAGQSAAPAGSAGATGAAEGS
ncbi:MAG: type VI secretion system ImpA family N-terminal domain-containing protein, partial [Chitinivibrionales bacterium]|nr:type VI secretion system ImpA family N-terminal domain-containing protein [Chitinivibrionales bacterium]